MNLFNPLLIKKYKNILQKNPESKVFCSLAQIYYMQKKFQAAKELCQKGLKACPHLSTAYILLAKIYKQENKFEKALEHLTRAKELNPDNYQIYQLLGEIYRQNQDLENTLLSFKMVVFLRPWDVTAQNTVQHLEKMLGQKELTPMSSTPTSEDELKNYKKAKQLQILQKLLSRVEKRQPVRKT